MIFFFFKEIDIDCGVDIDVILNFVDINMVVMVGGIVVRGLIDLYGVLMMFIYMIGLYVFGIGVVVMVKC